MLYHTVASKCFNCWVFGIGSPCEINKFWYRIKLFGVESQENVCYEGPVVSIEKPIQEVIDEEVGLVVTDSFVKRIWNNREIKCEVQIFQHKK
jgi:hypothetical protein